MQMRHDALDAHLAKQLAPLYVLASDEHLLAMEAADKIRKVARAQGFSEREVLTVERGFKWGELLAANQSQSLFGDKKLIELRIPTGKPGKDGGQALQALQRGCLWAVHWAPTSVAFVSNVSSRVIQPSCSSRMRLP